MKRYLLFLVVALLAIGCFTACSSDDNEGEESVTHLLPKGKIDLNKLPTVTSDEFFSKVADRGWKHLGTYEILSDGSLSSTDYYKGAIGYGPSDFYFSKNKITKFFYNDALGKLNKSTVGYHYDSSNNAIDIGENPNPFDRVYSCTDTKLLLVLYLGKVNVNNGQLRDHYGIACYTKMSDKELAEKQKNYEDIP